MIFCTPPPGATTALDLLGAHEVGPHAAELIAGACAAIEWGATVTDLAETIHPHPTVAEQFEEVWWEVCRTRQGGARGAA